MFTSADSTAMLLVASILLFPIAVAQVTTDCNPLNRTNCPADAALGTAVGFNFNSTPGTDFWETTVGKVTYDVENGAAFTIRMQKDSPTIRTKFYFFGGRVEVWMKTAKGRGVISSIMLLSDCLDEIDWESLGGNGSHISTNYFGKGHQDYLHGKDFAVSGGSQDEYHNYTIDWKEHSLDWYIDNSLVRTLLPKDANGSQYYPQTPMRLFLGIWAGGDPDNKPGVIEWAGGETDYGQGPYTMYVKSTHVADYSTGKEYRYGDQTGSWSSIELTAGNSSVVEALNNPERSARERFHALSPTAKVVIGASVTGLAVALAAGVICYFLRQRRRGAATARLEDARAEQDRFELERFENDGVDSDHSLSSKTPSMAQKIFQGQLLTSHHYTNI